MPLFVKLLLFVVLPLVLIALAAGVTAAVIGFRGTTLNTAESVVAGRQLDVDVRNASLQFESTSTDEVEVRVRGFYLGPTPEVTTVTENNVTSISGGCRNRFFGFCSVQIIIQVPENMPVQARGSNGRITASELSSPLSLRTTNGSINVSEPAGSLALRTTNGTIVVEDGRSDQVTVSTTNGRIDLDFDTAPSTVIADTTNGAVTVRVPTDGFDYFVNAETVNGSVTTDDVPSDRFAERTITASTTNGSVLVESTGR
jgi:hypothetical protein